MIFSLQKFKKSLKAAFNGLKIAILEEQTFRVFCIFAILVVILMILFEISFNQKLILILTIILTMAFELLNSQIERVLDVFYPAKDPKIRMIKDMSAGAVLLACLGALVIGILIFLPHFLKLL